MIMRICWDKVPKFMITIKPVFGNLGRVEGTFNATNGEKVYNLHSLVSRDMHYSFYEHELILAKED